MTIRPVDADIRGLETRRVWVRVLYFTREWTYTRTRILRVRLRVSNSTRGWIRIHPKTKKSQPDLFR